MAKEKKENKLRAIRIEFHHPENGQIENEEFNVKHEYEQGASGGYAAPSDQGTFSHHGHLMHHIHEHTKGHGPQGNLELSSSHNLDKDENMNQDSYDCPFCGKNEDIDKSGTHDKHGMKLSNLTTHGYHKGTLADPRKKATKAIMTARGQSNC